MGNARGLNHARQNMFLPFCDLTLCLKPMSDFDAKRTPNTACFYTVNQPMMNVIMCIERMHLCLVRKPPKRQREHKTVVILSVIGAIRIDLALFITEQ